MPRVSVEELAAKVAEVLRANGLRMPAARSVAAVVAAAERDGTKSHGLLRIPGYVSALRSGWVSGAAEPVRSTYAAGGLLVDAANGFSQPALEVVREELAERANTLGVSMALIRNSHHFAALWPDVEEFALRGFVAITAVNSAPRMAVWGASAPILGTNAMAFACPAAEGGVNPIVWDQASSVMSQGDLLLAREQNRSLPPGVGLDAHGRSTVSAAEVLAGGSLLPFGATKGGSIAFMVEILAAACTGACFGFENDERGIAGAPTSRGGQFMLLVRPPPSDATGSVFTSRVANLVAALRGAGVERLPGERRYAHRAESLASGILISDAEWRMLRETVPVAAEGGQLAG